MNIKVCFLVLFLSLNGRAGGFDLYESSVGTAAKTVVFVHGGAWIGGNKSQYKAVGETLAKSGFCAVVAGYSLAPAFKHPVPVKELNNILSELNLKSSKQCDFKNIFLVGHSAGAHMIAYWGTKYKNPSVKGLIGLEGIYDIPHIVQAFPDYSDWFVKAEFGLEKNWQAASPARLNQLSKTPWLVVHSKKDEMVDSKQARDFKMKLDLQNIKNELYWLDLDSHFEVVKKLEKPDSDLFKKISDFVKEN